MSKEYQFEARKGDVVRLPNSDTCGVIRHVARDTEAHYGEYGTLKVSVAPFTNTLQTLLLQIAGKLTFHDEEVNTLTHFDHLTVTI